MTFKKDDSAGYLINHVARIFAQALQQQIKPMGLTTGTFPALLELWQEDGLTQKQLVTRLSIEQATMANTLSRMERDGLIRRSKDERDARVQRVWLTDRAQSLQSGATDAALAVNADLLRVLSDTERDAFIHAMRKIIAPHRSTGT